MYKGGGYWTLLHEAAMDRSLSIDARSAPRRRVLKSGTITSARLTTSIDCAVRNISAMGACLTVAHPVGIPDDFKLLMSSADSIIRCRVAWQNGQRIGVSFC
jgi:PilZ domain-containing protein